MVHKAMLYAALVAAVALAGCTSGDGGDSDSDDGGTTDAGGGGVGGNVTVGNGTANGTVSASYSSTGTNASEPEAPDSAEVSIEDDGFVNDTVLVAVGGTVTWTHKGSNPHTVTADDDSFDSSPNCGANPIPFVSDCLEAGETFSQTFTTAGTHAYHCKVHSGMTGTVTVVE